MHMETGLCLVLTCHRCVVSPLSRGQPPGAGMHASRYALRARHLLHLFRRYARSSPPRHCAAPSLSPMPLPPGAAVVCLHHQKQQQQLPAAVFGDGLRIGCAKCSKLRREPPGNRPSKACTKKERYWFCEECVTGSPEAFVGRGIGVCRRDGKWKMATVRVRPKQTEEGNHGSGRVEGWGCFCVATTWFGELTWRLFLPGTLRSGNLGVTSLAAF